MAIFQGENIKFKITVTNQDGDVVPNSQVQSISANLYNENNRKVYISYADDNGDAGILDRLIRKVGDDPGPADPNADYWFAIAGVDSLTLLPGKYIIQIEYALVDTDFNKDNGQKIYKQNGALISIKKSI